MIKFTREQLVFVVEAAFIACLDRLESGTPTGGCSWEDRMLYVRQEYTGNPHVRSTSYENKAKGILPHDIGAIDMLGMTLSVLYAQLTKDGVSGCDITADWRADVKQWIESIWEDKGKHIGNKIEAFRHNRTSYVVGDVYGALYPDCQLHAVSFVNQYFGDYLKAKEPVKAPITRPGGGEQTHIPTNLHEALFPNHIAKHKIVSLNIMTTADKAEELRDTLRNQMSPGPSCSAPTVIDDCNEFCIVSGYSTTVRDSGGSEIVDQSKLVDQGI